MAKNLLSNKLSRFLAILIPLVISPPGFLENLLDASHSVIFCQEDSIHVLKMTFYLPIW